MARPPQRSRLGPGSGSDSGSSLLSRRALLGLGAVGATAWTVNRSTGWIGWLSGIDAADASSPAVASSSAAEAATTTTTTAEAAAAAVDASQVSAAPAAVPLVALGEAKQLVFTPPRASTAFRGLLVRPPADQRSTAIVLVHGGGATGGSQADSVSWSDWYRDHGYLTFSIDYRLVDPAADAGIYPIPEQNTKAAVQYLRMHAEELGIDRIVVQGHSAGARLGAILATTADLPAFSGREVWPDVSDRIDGFIGFYGYYDGLQYQPVAYYGGAGDAPSTAVSNRRAAQASGPVYLLHGQADSIVGVGRSQDFADALEAAGVDVVLELVPGADHGYDGYGSPALTSRGLETAGRLVAWIESEI